MSKQPDEAISRSEMMRRSNQEVAELWAIDTECDPRDVPLDQLNPGHPDLFEARVELSYFARLREEDPVHYCADSQFGPYWSVTKYRDIVEVDSSHQIYSSDSRLGGITLGGIADPDPDPTFHLPMFIQEDPPKHDDQRKTVAPMFTPRHLTTMAELIRERAGTILDALPRNEEFNWVREVSVELTGQMLATLFDIPQEDRHKLIHWSDTTQNIANPEFFDTPEAGFQELWKCYEYFDAVWKERAALDAPGNDLISMLAHGESTRDMPPNEYLGNVLLLIVGGNDTTRNSISAGVLALNENPAEYERLLQNPGLVTSMVPEIIRWQTPVAHMARTVAEDTELGGKHLTKGERVVMWYISGNRDEEVIENADQFIIDRANPRQHLAFGFGIHRCLGNRLGEMQLKIIWEEILKRFPTVEVVGDPVYLKSSFIRGIRELPVRIPG
ncbi:MAG: cytochrome P450 [Gammaproteobacteria bacterium]|nr:cytochrome P450 [Gammaproteobacteria bacterium]